MHTWPHPDLPSQTICWWTASIPGPELQFLSVSPKLSLIFQSSCMLWALCWWTINGRTSHIISNIHLMERAFIVDVVPAYIRQFWFPISSQPDWRSSHSAAYENLLFLHSGATTQAHRAFLVHWTAILKLFSTKTHDVCTRLKKYFQPITSGTLRSFRQPSLTTFVMFLKVAIWIDHYMHILL